MLEHKHCTSETRTAVRLKCTHGNMNCVKGLQESICTEYSTCFNHGCCYSKADCFLGNTTSQASSCHKRITACLYSRTPSALQPQITPFLLLISHFTSFSKASLQFGLWKEINKLKKSPAPLPGVCSQYKLNEPLKGLLHFCCCLFTFRK